MTKKLYLVISFFVLFILYGCCGGTPRIVAPFLRPNNGTRIKKEKTDDKIIEIYLIKCEIPQEKCGKGIMYDNFMHRVLSNDEYNIIEEIVSQVANPSKDLISVLIFPRRGCLKKPRKH